MKDRSQSAKAATHTRAQNAGLEVSLNPLTFEDALSALLEVKPVDNADLKKTAPKKKNKPKTKK